MFCLKYLAIYIYMFLFIYDMYAIVCFLPGILALGAYTNPNGLDSEIAQRDLAVAKALMFTCYEMYHFTPTHISPEYVDFPSRGSSDMSVPDGASFYILRPETAESLFVLAQLTGESIYREWSWEIFQAIEKICRVQGGYATLHDVRDPSGLEDRMESFFLAETMKYLYMAQDINNSIDILNTYVLNTEAHPIKIFDNSHQPVMT